MHDFRFLRNILGMDTPYISDFVPHSVKIYKDLSITQILREINFGESRSPKTSVFKIMLKWYVDFTQN